MSSLSSTQNSRLAIVLVTIASLLVPVTTTGAQETKPFASFSASAQSLRDSAVQIARAQLGKRYRLGGQSPEKGFDCSGLVSYIMSALSVNVPRTAKQQATQSLALTKKDTSRLLPGGSAHVRQSQEGREPRGDLRRRRRIHPRQQRLHGKVIESAIDRPFSPLIKAWRGARRLLTLNDSTATTDSLLPPPASKGGD